MAKGVRIGIILIVLAVCAGGRLIAQSPTPTPTPAPAPTPQASNPTQSVSVSKKYPTPSPPYPKAKNWYLVAGPNMCTVQENGKDVPVAVIWRGTHSITYTSDAHEPLAIRFHAPSDTPTAPMPFSKMTWAGTDEDGSYIWSLVCNPSYQCKTGPAVSGSKGGYWKTDQIFPGKECDAGIIIQP
jgi:hypothetical protein